MDQRCGFDQVMIRFVARPDSLIIIIQRVQALSFPSTLACGQTQLTPGPTCRGSLLGRMLARLPSILVATDVDRPMKSPLLGEKLSWPG